MDNNELSSAYENAEHTNVNYGYSRNVEYEEAVAYLESLGIVAENKKSTLNTHEIADAKVVGEMEEKTGIKYSEEQRAVLMNRGNSLIIACAGSGKTTTLAHLIAKRIKSGEIDDVEKMVCTTFSKDGAKDLKKRVLQVLKASTGSNKSDMERFNKIRICTLHAFFLELLRTFGSQAQVIKEYERTALVKEACKSVYSFIDKDDIDIIGQLLSFQVNKLYSDEETIKHTTDLKCEIDEAKYAKIRQEFARLKAAGGVIDFDDMQLILYQWICLWEKSEYPEQVALCKQVKDYCHTMFRYYFIDESQDISEIQFAIIKALTIIDNKACCSITYVGDDDQSIYSWRGSNPNIILTLGDKYMNMNQFKLTTNRRCADNILMFAREGIENNLFRYDKEMKSIHDKGVVYIDKESDTNLYSYSSKITEYVLKKINEGYALNEIAVLARNNMHACLVPYMLAENGVYCKTRDEMRLVNYSGYKDIKDIIDICLGEDNTFTVKRVLWKLIPYMSVAKCGKVASEISGAGGNLRDYLEAVFGKNSDKALKSRLSDSLREILGGFRLYDSMADLYGVINAKNDASRINNMLFHYMNNTFGYLYKSADTQRIIEGIVWYINNKIKSNGIERTASFLHMMEQLDSGSVVTPGDKVEISTIHSAKGREWDCVAIIACDTIGFPDSFSIESYATESARNEFIEEERRLFYVGCTRARKDLFITVPAKHDKVSPFVMEACNVDRDGAALPNNFVLRASLSGYTIYEEKDFDKKVADINKKCSDVKGDEVV